MKSFIPHILLLILFSGCTANKQVLFPVINDELRIQSENWVNANIPEEYRKYFLFNAAYTGNQCYPGLDNSRTDGLKFKTFEPQYLCTCYNYDLKTELNQKVYLGTKSTTSISSKICFDSEKKMVEEPNKESIIAAAKHLNKKFIPLSSVKSITKNKIKIKTKFDKFPILIYRTNEDKILWEVTRRKGWLNLSLYEFKIDAVTGEIIQLKESPAHITFWQWIFWSGF